MSDKPRTGGLFEAPEPPKGPSAQARELKDLVVNYAKQETLEPLKVAGANLGYAMGGAVLISLGWVCALLALLRGLQTIDFFNDPAELNGGTWSWLPYLIVGIVAVAVIAFYGLLVKRRMSTDRNIKDRAY
jgi:uncharacterized membrane protein YuzA (DUF378 family)